MVERIGVKFMNWCMRKIAKRMPTEALLSGIKEYQTSIPALEANGQSADSHRRMLACLVGEAYRRGLRFVDS